MKLVYDDGCFPSLTVDGVETIDLGEEKMKEVIKKLIRHIFKEKSECVRDVIKGLVETVGVFHSYLYGDNQVYDEITVSLFGQGRKIYLTALDVPLFEALIVNEVVCDYTKIVRQAKWDNDKHCTEDFLKMAEEMVDLIDDFADLQQIFCKVLERAGHEEGESYVCEQCGSLNVTYVLEV